MIAASFYDSHGNERGGKTPDAAEQSPRKPSRLPALKFFRADPQNSRALSEYDRGRIRTES